MFPTVNKKRKSLIALALIKLPSKLQFPWEGKAYANNQDEFHPSLLNLDIIDDQVAPDPLKP